MLIQVSKELRQSPGQSREWALSDSFGLEKDGPEEYILENLVVWQFLPFQRTSVSWDNSRNLGRIGITGSCFFYELIHICEVEWDNLLALADLQAIKATVDREEYIKIFGKRSLFAWRSVNHGSYRFVRCLDWRSYKIVTVPVTENQGGVIGPDALLGLYPGSKMPQMP